MQLPLNPVTPFNIQALMNLPSTTIQPGDTWQSISMRLLGADYSACFHASGIPLSIGEQVTVPQLLSIYDKANSFTPEEKLFGAIYNALNPALKTPQYVPPPPPSHHHSFWYELIEAAVAIAIFAFAPHLIGLEIFGAGALASSTVPVMIATTMAGALASAAQQGVAICFGDQQGFSAEQIVSYAATAGLTAGFSKALGLDAKLKAGGLENVAKVFIGTATLNATTQAFEIAIGIQHKFDVKLLIEQSIASLIAGLSHTLSDANVFTHVLSPVTNDVINAGMGVAFGYPIDTEQLAADMLADEAVDTACDALSSVTPAAQKTSIDQTKILEPVHFSDQSLNEESHEIDQLMHSDAGLVDHMGDDFLGTYENTLTTGIRAINAATAFSLKPDVQRQRQIRTSTSSTPHFFGGALKTAENAVKFGYGFAVGAGHAVGDMTYEAMNALEHPARTAMAMYAMGQSADEKLMHFAQALMNPDTRPTAIADAKNTVKFAGVALFSKLKSLDAEGRGEALGDLTAEAASFLMPGAEEVGLTEIIDTRLPLGLQRANPKEIRFTQPTVGTHLSNGTPINKFFDDLRSGKISPEDLPPIRVIQDKTGKLFSLDNRRLLAFNTVQIKDVPIEVVSLKNPEIYETYRERYDPIENGEKIVISRKADREMSLKILKDCKKIKGDCNGPYKKRNT